MFLFLLVDFNLKSSCCYSVIVSVPVCVCSLCCVVHLCLWAPSCLCWSACQTKPYGASACTSFALPEGGSMIGALRSCWTDVLKRSYPTPITSYRRKTWSVLITGLTFEVCSYTFSFIFNFTPNSTPVSITCLISAGTLVAKAPPRALWSHKSGLRQQHPPGCSQR